MTLNGDDCEGDDFVVGRGTERGDCLSLEAGSAKEKKKQERTKYRNLRDRGSPSHGVATPRVSITCLLWFVILPDGRGQVLAGFNLSVRLSVGCHVGEVNDRFVAVVEFCLQVRCLLLRCIA